MARLDLSRFEEIDWDSEDDSDGNWVHCSRADHLGPNPERVVAEVLAEQPGQIKLPLQTAEYSIVGPDSSWASWWVVLFDVSYKRGDWLRPVTGWPAEVAERRAWEQQFRGSR